MSFFDVAKFFDKESLLNCMDTLNKKLRDVLQEREGASSNKF